MPGDSPKSNFETFHGELTDGEKEYQRMLEAGCEPFEHVGQIDLEITMSEEVSVDKVCSACDVAVEGWSYTPNVESVELHLSNGEVEKFNRSKNDDDAE